MNSRKKLISLVVLAALAATAYPAQAHAVVAEIGWGALKAFWNLITGANAVTAITASVIGWVVYGVNYIIGVVAGVFFAIAAWLVEWALFLNNNVLSNPVVAIGWGVVRDVANLAFVLIIIIIAFATILRFESYGMKQTLWKLIVAAILVNFSLVIAGVFVDFAGVLTEYFQKESNLGVGKTADNFARAFQLNKLLTAGDTKDKTETKYFVGLKDVTAKIKPETCATTQAGGTAAEGEGVKETTCETIDGETLKNVYTKDVFIKGKNKEVFEGASAGYLTSAMMVAIASVIFNVVFTVLALLTLMAVTVMFLIRYIALGILLIVMPFAWAAWVLPSTEGPVWGAWWKSFLKWVMFAPIMMFFIWLAFKMVDILGSTGYGLFDKSYDKLLQNDAAQAINQSLGQESPTQIIGQMVMIIGILLGGLYAATQFSITGANTFMGWAKGMGKYAQGIATRKSRVVGRMAWDRFRTSGGKYDQATKETTTRLQRWGSRLQAIPLMRNVGSVVAKHGAVVPKIRPEDIEKYRKEKLESLDKAGLINRATARGAFLDHTAAAAIGQELARRDLTEDPQIAPLMEKFLDVAERMGNIQAIYNNRLDLVRAEPGESRENALARALRGVKAENITQIAHKTLGDYENASTQPNNDQINIVLNLSNAQINRLGTTDDRRQVEAIRNTLQWVEHNQQDLTPAQQIVFQREFGRIQDLINKNPNWQNI